MCNHQIIDRLPLPLERLKQFKLGKLIMKLMKEPPTPGELKFPCLRRVMHLSQERCECFSSEQKRLSAMVALRLRRTVAAPYSATVDMYMYLTTVPISVSSQKTTKQRSRTWRRISSGNGDSKSLNRLEITRKRPRVRHSQRVGHVSL